MTMDVGISLAVPAPWGDEIRAIRRDLGDVLAHQVPTHITVLPPLTVFRADRQTIGEHLSEAARTVEPFTVELRGTDTFRPVSPVVFLPLVQGADECRTLAEAVNRGPLGVPLKFPYHPHVTVVQNVPEEVLDAAAEQMQDYHAVFQVEQLTRYVAGPDGAWRPLDSWYLGSGEAVSL
ncbi:2'-5' RNA ligase [Kytococcus aerolatus]|uniref:2'-5' RNA ligase n=1 Tax=Kytococcus aerolatus TaxID=592308 RepID=A0A212TZN9_9MICO|nr:2'-5' RNA ligase family protein [Kytococcus aerolatus]SNC71351.1 2'-5' RNA ligase [Kytococcus aerolatus]